MEKYIDLHRHLDGSVSNDIARKLAEISGKVLPEDERELHKLLTVPSDCKSLNDFLKCFELPLELMQTPESIEEALRLAIKEAEKEGIIYAEFRFAPGLHTDKGMCQRDVFEAALKGLEASPIKTNLIMCLMRGSGNEDANEETFRLTKEYLVDDGGVVALDLAGAESLFPTVRYREIFEKARANRIPFTIHAGEADGAGSIARAIEYGASRIGHGVRITENKELLKTVIDREIPLEMCPTSNLMTCAVDGIANHPFMDLMEKGVKVTLNTDDPAIEGTTIAEEYNIIEKEFGMTSEQKTQIFMNSIEAAFTTPAVKNYLKSLTGKDD